ncbi:hypothetical protein [Halochromatium glycolicum]|uniref:Uncharacterized protein n=1 Tax=Halochromatium glycolicum TaxID=85075 RepID=A0AAJ0U466_9GAMM|nr:hypothetical protein [Halochromatium glycolicum]MBK1704897.1 hypothetical protein [Halochromatium glycolicum]
MLGIMSGAVAGPIWLSEYQAANQEGQIQFDFGGQLFAAGRDRVKVEFNNGKMGRTVRVDAGLFGGEAEAVPGDPFDPASLYRSEDDVLLYCADLFENLKKEQNTYGVLRISDDTLVQTATNGTDVIRNFGQVLDFLGALNWVLGTDQYTYGLAYGEQNWLNPQAGWMSGAIQIGIWESLYEVDAAEDMDITSGIFRVSPSSDSWNALDSRGVELLERSFTAMLTTEPLSDRGVRWFQLDGGQDLLGDPVQVPAPTTGVLIVSGLLLLVNARRRRG